MRLLIIHTFGLGDMVMFTPALQKLIELYPDVKIDFLIFQNIATEPIKSCSNVNNIYFCNFNLSSLLKSILKLRENSYDKIITTSGTNPNKIALLYLFLRGKEKIAEYKKKYQKLFFDTSIKYIEKLHRVENNNLLVSNEIENKYLLKFFGINKIQKNSNNIRIGIHAGSNPKFVNKRWKKEYFVNLIQLLNENFKNLEFFIFSGPEEIKESEYIVDYTNNSKLIKNKSLLEVANLISTCDIFINTDSGLGHIAGCFDIEIFTIFGPAKDYKAKVYSNNVNVIKLKLECQPCYGTQRLKKCKTFECLNHLTPNLVFKEISKKSKVLKKCKMI